MKMKQLANVLIKILGLSVCLNAIPTFVAGVAIGLSSFESTERGLWIMRSSSSVFGGGIQAVVGVLFVIKSRKIAELLFKDENE